MTAELITLSRLWLGELSPEVVNSLASAASVNGYDPSRLEEEYAAAFLLNVPPYGSVFTDPNAELNGESALLAAAAYESINFKPDALRKVAAPDHMGVVLAALGAGEGSSGPEFIRFLSDLGVWGARCCTAVSVEPSAGVFFRAAAKATRSVISGYLTARGVAEATHEGSREGISDGWGANELTRYMLTPARCGAYISRSRIGELALAMGVRLPFGSRFEVMRIFLEAVVDADARQWEKLEGVLVLQEDDGTATVLRAVRDGARLRPPAV